MQRQQFIPRNLEQIRRHAIEQRKLREEKEKNNANIKRKSSAPNNDLDAIRQIMNSKTTDEIQSKYFDVDRQKKHMIKMLHDCRIYNETYIYEIFKFIQVYALRGVFYIYFIISKCCIYICLFS